MTQRVSVRAEHPPLNTTLNQERANVMPKKLFPITHGLSKSKEYHIWCIMLQRCYNPNDPSYQYYGASGITVCDEWRHSFETFLADMGPRTNPKHTIERINNSIGYSKENCKWDTRKEQARNRRNSVRLSVRGVEGCLSALCEHFEKDYFLVHQRLKYGWDVERAFFEPQRRYSSQQ